MIHLSQEVYSTVVTKLILRVKRLEKIVKSSKARRRAKIVVSDDEKVSDDSSKQERMISMDRNELLCFKGYLPDVARVHTYSRRKRTVSIGSGEVSTAIRIISTAKETVSTAGASMPVSTACLVQEITSLSRASKDKEQRDQEESQRIARDAKIALRLQEEIDAAGRQRMANSTYTAAQGFFRDEWENIRARVEACQEVLEEPAKRQKIGEASGSGEEQSAEKEVSEEELQKLLVVVLVEEVYIEALQVKNQEATRELSELETIQKSIRFLKIC
ncbi:hypothetical protein Tco_1371191 [Tanacetum coccineum]